MSKRDLLAFVLIITVGLCALSDVPVRVDAHTNIATYAIMAVEPNPVTIGDSVAITVLIVPTPPSFTGSFDNISITFDRPDGTAETCIYHTPSGSGECHFVYTPTLGGNWIVKLSFPGDFYANNTIYYLPCKRQTTLTVLPVPAPQPTPFVGFWTQKAPMHVARGCSG